MLLLSVCLGCLVLVCLLFIDTLCCFGCLTSILSGVLVCVGVWFVVLCTSCWR